MATTSDCCMNCGRPENLHEERKCILANEGNKVLFSKTQEFKRTMSAEDWANIPRVDSNLELTREPAVPKYEPEIESPSHYVRPGKAETWDLINELGLCYMLGNVLKYLSRAGHKVLPGQTKSEAELADLCKAQQYLDKKISMLRSEIE